MYSGHFLYAGRAVMVFDNSRENVVDPDHMIEYLAFNMELCRRTALLHGRGANKIMLLMHMAGALSNDF